MDLAAAKRLISACEADLAASPFVVVHAFVRDGRTLEVALTERLRLACRRGRVWNKKPFLTAFKNASYGFDPRQGHSPGGSDGIFLLTRTHRPENAMMRKIYDRYLDHPERGAGAVASALGVSVDALLAVRLVSHHLRLLGVLWRGADKDTLVLVDYDDTP
jgi:hypothetical protein